MHYSKLPQITTLFLLLLITINSVAQDLPALRVIPEEGTVQFRTRDGDWERLSNTRYLFNGNAVRTLDGASATVETSGRQYLARLVENSEIEIEDNMVNLVRGEFVNSRILASNVLSKLKEKLDDALRFVSVRRQAPCEPVIRTARNLNLSSNYPDLVWHNACPTYLYRLTIDGDVYDIPMVSGDDIVRFTVSGIAPGDHEYRVEILDEGRVIYSPSSDSSFVWVDDPSAAEIHDQVSQLDQDIFAQTDYLEENGFLVEVMFKYRNYFETHSEENYLRPLLIKAYAELGLYGLQSREVRLYNSLRNI